MCRLPEQRARSEVIDWAPSTGYRITAPSEPLFGARELPGWLCAQYAPPRSCSVKKYGNYVTTTAMHPKSILVRTRPLGYYRCTPRSKDEKMDEAPRTRSRSIRALGRLAPPKVEDVLLAQWAGCPSDKGLLDDIALSTDWAGTPESPCAFLHSTPLPPAHHKATLKAFECHLTESVRRMMEAIEADVEGDDRMPLSYEAPPVSKDAAFDAITALSLAGEMTVRRARNRRQKLTALTEASARLWVLADLFRSGHIGIEELARKRDEIASQLG